MKSKSVQRALLPLLALLVLPGSCAKPEKPAASSAPAGSVNVERHPFKGVIQAVDPVRSQITVSHDAIDGYMDAMTMPFPVRDDPRIVAILRPGDKIEAILVVGKDKYWLENILTKGFVPTPASEVAAVAAGRAVTPVPNSAVGVGDLVPDFTLTDQTGAPVRLSQLRGQPVAITFLYTRCPIAAACPLTAAKFSQLDAMLQEKKFGQLLTLTLDPEHDTPAVLADYARKSGANPKRWRFLTGDPRAVADVASHFGILYYPDHGQLVHGQGVAVIDPQGKLSMIYYGNDWKAEHILRDLTRARDAS